MEARKIDDVPGLVTLDRGVGLMNPINLGQRRRAKKQPVCKVEPPTMVQKLEAALDLWPDKLVPWQEVQKVDQQLVLEVVPDMQFEPAPTMSQVLKNNPYHDEHGQFTDKNHATSVHHAGRKIPIGRATELHGAEREKALALFGKSTGPGHKELVDAATYSGGQYQEHSHTSSAMHSSRSIRVPERDAGKVMDRALTRLQDAGFKLSGTDLLTGATKLKNGEKKAEVWYNNGVLHVTVKH